MDAKSKANFINSVAGARKIPCPNCNTLNDADSMFCAICGTKIGSEPEAANINTKASRAINDNQASTSSDQAATTSTSSAPAFTPACAKEEKTISEPDANEQKSKSDAAKPAFQMAALEPEELSEEVSVFAEGLPDWDMVPPQVVVRRKRK